MAKAKLNPVMEQVRGKIGDLVFRRYEDRILVARRPNRDGLVPTTGQTDHRERFRQAAAYAKGAFADPAQKALYDAVGKARRKPAFALAVGDYLVSPVVDLIDLTQYTGQAGQTIIVRAHDDFAVTAVNVTLKDNTGAMIEQGPASLELGVWRYITTEDLPTERPVTIEAVATDRPGNRTKSGGGTPQSLRLYSRAFFTLGAPAAGRHLDPEIPQMNLQKVTKETKSRWLTRNEPREFSEVSVGCHARRELRCAMRPALFPERSGEA